MNLFDFCERYAISLTKARKMQKDGALRIDETIPDALAQIRNVLSHNWPLTAAHFVELVDNPGSVLDLGRFAGRAQEQLDALGDVRGETAPKLVAAYVTDAAKNDPEAVDALLEWLRRIIPGKPVGHSFIAVRLLLGLAPNIRQYDIPRIPRALLNCRQRLEFAGWWRVEKMASRNVTVYQRPRKKEFDL